MPRYIDQREADYQKRIRYAKEVEKTASEMKPKIILAGEGILTPDQKRLIYEMFSKIVAGGIALEKSQKLPAVNEIAAKLLSLNICEEASGSNRSGLTLKINNGPGKPSTIFTGKLGHFAQVYFLYQEFLNKKAGTSGNTHQIKLR